MRMGAIRLEAQVAVIHVIAMQKVIAPKNLSVKTVHQSKIVRTRKRVLRQ